jgi:hypothetical protein
MRSPGSAIPETGSSRSAADRPGPHGLFIHWGLYALGGWHEQQQFRLGVPRLRLCHLPVNRYPDTALVVKLEFDGNLRLRVFAASGAGAKPNL